MVKLNRVYTRTGDDGATVLVGGQRVPKNSARVEAYGAVDEANAAIGMALVEASRPSGQGLIDRRIAGVLRAVQNDLFDLGADLATPRGKDEQPDQSLRVADAQVEHVEGWIDEFNAGLADLTSFVLPGGTPLAASLHLARTVTRRAERRIVQLLAEESEQTPDAPLRYLNRLSDLLFVLGRVANENGRLDVLWEPGRGRGD